MLVKSFAFLCSKRVFSTRREGRLARFLAAELAALRVALREDAEKREAALRVEAKEREAALFARLSKREILSPSAPSFANVGHEALEALERSRRIHVAPTPPESANGNESAPFASIDDLERLRSCKTERDLVAEITHLLRVARGFDETHAAEEADPCARVLVNSEQEPWLDALNAPLPVGQLKRPDLFATWSPFWSGYDDGEMVLRGRLASRTLQLDRCTAEFYEAKVGVGELTASDFGQLIDCHSRVAGSVRGILFNARVFWLYESVRRNPVALTKGEWGARGSRALLRTFFDAAVEPPLVPLLRHLCRELRVRFRRVNDMGLEPLNGRNEPASAFLGAGGSARVFCVANEGATDHFALKVSTNLSRSDLAYEFSALQQAADAGAPVVPVVPNSFTVFVDANGEQSGGGFLLRDVCVRVVADSAARCTAAFEALRALHAVGIVHGDARLPNLLASRTDGTKLLWIDLRQVSAEGLAAAQRDDARSLAASTLRIAQGGALSTRIEEKLADVPDGGDAAYTALAETVWATLIKVE